MSAFENQTRLIDAKSMRIRHIFPGTGEGETKTLLGKTYGFTELPLSHIPTSHDLVEGSYTHRIGDSGEFVLTFPNAAGEKGLWRDRFSADGALEFIEIYHDDYLEFVGSIQRVELDDTTVTISGPDAWALLRRAYERDRLWTAAPNEVINAYSRVPVMAIAQDFRYNDTTDWTTSTIGTGAYVAIVDSSFLRLSTSTAGGGEAKVTWPSWIANDGDWTLTTQVERLNFDRHSTTGSPDQVSIYFGVQGNGGSSIDPLATVEILVGQRGTAGSQYVLTRLRVHTPDGQELMNGYQFPSGYMTLPTSLTLQKQGRWIRAYVNNRLIGAMVASTAYPDIKPFLEVNGSTVMATNWDVDVSGIYLELQTPFLSRDSDTGKKVLPTDFPYGGLRARFWNDSDLEGIGTARRWRIMSPERNHYGERLEDNLNGMTLPLQPGAEAKYWSARWFGAVYLRPSLGDYDFKISFLTGGARLWVADTRFEDAVIDEWDNTTASASYTGTVTASSLGGDDGWYPIIVEMHTGATNGALVLEFEPPASYTDLGGYSLTGGAFTPVPYTSLSPLGIFDNRVQGQTHFDLTQQVANQFGYQQWCEPKQLESDHFPGKVVPRVRLGQDFDTVLEADTEGGEIVLSPGVTIDASEQTYQLIGTGAGQNAEQLTNQIVDSQGVQNGLFSLQTWLDAGDIAYPDLLSARLNAELALRNSPWEEVRGTPLTQDRLADTWPLSGTLSAMRWLPGDGIRFRLPELGVVDQETRQITQVTRTFMAEGRTNTQLAFRQRPRSAAASIRTIAQRAMSYNRTSQGRYLTLSSDLMTETIGANNFGNPLGIDLGASDKIVGARVRLGYNISACQLYLYKSLTAGNVDVTANLGGPWTSYAVDIDVFPVIERVGLTDWRVFFAMYNNSGFSGVIQWMFYVDVYRPG